ncbi:MAG: RHS repeat-associated core domain-containing protein [Acidobacteria bacterium ACB1]|nr:hypothetical protein [Pyrinomonadaceae bacterium]MCE7962088.1 RHS repeat-associated core domain-containing protein [Acidobacteria bacterium ACB1]RIJ95431.1 MAG: hypothetical protein DCC44_02275 [Acidobacteriota bacterium]
MGSPRVNTDASGAVIARHDYLPFGEEIDGVGGRTAGLNYGDDTIRKQFTGYERDTETALDFAQARYFNSGYGRFSSPDPLATSASSVRPQSWNRYSYSYNNPIRFSDPSGMLAGDFYNLDGKKIGTDGVDDGKIRLVTDKDEAKKIKTTKGPYTQAVNSEIVIPNSACVTATVAAVDRSNNPTADDKKGRHHEEAVVAGRTNGGPLQTVEIKAGAFTPLNSDKVRAAEIDVSVPANPSDTIPSDIEYEAHVHPAGPPKDMSSSVSSTVFNNTVSRDFIQEPSSVDTNHATNAGTTYVVVGAGNSTVYFYNSSVTKAEMSYGAFKRLGR